MNKKIVILGSQSNSTTLIFNRVNQLYPIEKVLIEQKEDFRLYFSRRIKKLGFSKVVGQFLFMLIIVPILKLMSSKRVKELNLVYKFDYSLIPVSKVINVKSVNSNETIEYLKKNQPDVILVAGTRIISKKVLSSVHSRFINIHAGITPFYRGVHGAYWALANNDAENMGVTVHYVDKGIDTGKILIQEQISIIKEDNFYTYPLIQLGVGLANLEKVLFDIVNEQFQIKENEIEAKGMLWYHPTLVQYLSYRIKKGIK
jgi:folate-dependent phosphoribosylglycinamide formyltransferase PurN